MSSIIITSNVWGFVTGEWKTAGKKALTTMLAGILFLIVGFVTLAVSGRLAGEKLISTIGQGAHTHCGDSASGSRT